MEEGKFIGLDGIPCYRCGVKMVRTDITPIGMKIPDPVDSFYFTHPKSNCRVGDYVVKVGHRI